MLWSWNVLSSSTFLLLLKLQSNRLALRALRLGSEFRDHSSEKVSRGDGVARAAQLHLSTWCISKQEVRFARLEGLCWDTDLLAFLGRLQSDAVALAVVVAFILWADLFSSSL